MVFHFQWSQTKHRGIVAARLSRTERSNNPFWGVRGIELKGENKKLEREGNRKGVQEREKERKKEEERYKEKLEREGIGKKEKEGRRGSSRERER